MKMKMKMKIRIKINFISNRETTKVKLKCY